MKQSSGAQVRLFTAPDVVSVWEEVFLPWLRDSGTNAWQRARPTLVVVPSRSDAYFLKGRALEEKMHLLGVRFVTPTELRELLVRQLPIEHRPALREHSRLLLAAAAEGAAADHRAAAAVASAPDHLLKAVDQLSAGGWSFADAGPELLRPIVARFEIMMKQCGLTLMHDADRELLRRVRTADAPLFSEVFIGGFNGLHWPLWPLLAPAVQAAESATIALTNPRLEAEELDTAWIGNWEENFAPAEAAPLGSGDAPPFADLLYPPQTRKDIAALQSAPITAIDFLVGQNTREQARAIVVKTLSFLADERCARLGILFPAPGALARTVADLLAAHRVPHNDGLGHVGPGDFEHPEWPAWLALQESPRVEMLLRFLRVSRCANLFPNVDLHTIEDVLRRTLSDVLIDDLAVIAEALEAGQRRHVSGSTTAQSDAGTPRGKVAAGLRALRFLPSSGTPSHLLAETDAIFHDLGWKSRAAELRRLSEGWLTRLDVRISRRSWLRWLREVLVSFAPQRAPFGNHPYSRVHLLTYAQGETQPWSHLIVAGLNEGEWPPAFEDSGYLGEQDITLLNASIRQLNRRAVRQGRHGEGHASVAPGKTLCLGPAEQREVTLRQFLNAVESTSVAVTATASLTDEAKPDRLLNPSDYFTRLYFCARGKAISQAGMAALRVQTARWLQSAEEPRLPNPTVLPTRRAFEKRRDVSQPFGEFEFALREAPALPLSLAATDWEKALQNPAITWMRLLLGVAAREDSAEGDPWNLAIGNWTHRWLRAICGSAPANAFLPIPPPAEILARVRGAAATFRDDTRALLAKCGRELPDWWLSGWEQALYIATSLARKIEPIDGCTHMAGEWKLPRTTLPLDGDSKLDVRGRIDLILAPGDAPLPGAWIVDYKTGSRKSLAPSRSAKSAEEQNASVAKRFRKGEGVQLALYALGLREFGAAPRGATLLTPTLPLDRPQLTLAQIEAQHRLWHGLSRMQASGAFGMLGELRSEFAFGRVHPLATLAIDTSVLEEKWALTHPEFADDSDALEPA